MISEFNRVPGPGLKAEEELKTPSQEEHRHLRSAGTRRARPPQARPGDSEGVTGVLFLCTDPGP